MAKNTPTQSERADFAAFCKGATESQLIEIERKERLAGREAFAEIAEAERESRA